MVQRPLASDLPAAGTIDHGNASSEGMENCTESPACGSPPGKGSPGGGGGAQADGSIYTAATRDKGERRRS
jgi:hypothetical protein